MKVYVFTITLKDSKGNIEYTAISGVYDNKETAKKEATKRFNIQKSLWPMSNYVKISKNKVALFSSEGYSKIYHILERELKF